MKLYTWKQVMEETLTPATTRQMIHGESITIAKLRTKKGSIVPTHSHVNEQITNVEEGAMLFVFPDQRIVVRAGESLVIPPNVPHSVESLEDCLAMDIFSPTREDWIRGDDAYLRGPAKS
jgi:unsaturated pyranuronate lyase